MSKKQPPLQPDDDSVRRAQEIADAFLNIPGYGDDSMLFMARYTEKALVCNLSFLLSLLVHFFPFLFLFDYGLSTPVNYLLPSTVTGLNDPYVAGAFAVTNEARREQCEKRTMINL